MLILIFGSSGIGLVWGWLLGSFFTPNRRLTYVGIIAMVVETLAVGATVLFFSNLNSVIAFSSSVLFTLWLRTTWYRTLRERSQILNP
jgi:hypothetical protein